MRIITDEFMKHMLSKTKQYSVVILKAGTNREKEEIEKIIWEHGRRNFGLRADGVLPIVCAVSDGSDVAGVRIFDATVVEVKEIMDEDPSTKPGFSSTKYMLDEVFQVTACQSDYRLNNKSR